jgi:hypothetical protein
MRQVRRGAQDAYAEGPLQKADRTLQERSAAVATICAIKKSSR